jgi:hypothetical protein
MKIFDQRTDRYAIRKARFYAESGGQALHVWEPGKGGWPGAPACFRQNRPWAHLLDNDKERLCSTVKSLGVRKFIVHRADKDGQHIDLCGQPLLEAIKMGLEITLFSVIGKCRLCGSENLVEAVRFEPQYLSSLFVEDNSKEWLSNIKIPMTLLLCKDCCAVQLRETVNPDLMYSKYFYRSSVNTTMNQDLKDVVDCAVREAGGVGEEDYIIDIGSNDAMMLGMFPGGKRIGVEPAKNIVWDGIDSSIKIVNDYFTKESVQRECGDIKAKIITSCACFYDFPDPNKAVQDIKELLADDGVCVVQVSHLLATVKDMNWYDICQEHIFYYSLQVLNHLFGSHGLAIYDCETNHVNGGSLRVYVRHAKSGSTKSDRFYQILGEEIKYGLSLERTYQDFAKNIQRTSQKVHDFLLKEKEAGHLVLGLGASTKANILFQVCGVTKELMPAISERSPIKIGKRTLGSDIPMISEAEAHKMNPDVFLCPIWNFKSEVVGREKEYLEKGGRILFVMPYPYVLTKDGETKL